MLGLPLDDPEYFTREDWVEQFVDPLALMFGMKDIPAREKRFQKIFKATLPEVIAQLKKMNIRLIGFPSYIYLQG